MEGEALQIFPPSSPPPWPVSDSVSQTLTFCYHLPILISFIFNTSSSITTIFSSICLPPGSLSCLLAFPPPLPPPCLSFFLPFPPFFSSLFFLFFLLFPYTLLLLLERILAPPGALAFCVVGKEIVFFLSLPLVAHYSERDTEGE